MDSITLSWGYGTRNAGDVSINHGALTLLNDIFPGVAPSVISRYPESSREIDDTRQLLDDYNLDYELSGGPFSYDPKHQSDIEQIVSLGRDGFRYLRDVAISRDFLTTSSKRSIKDSEYLLFNGGNVIHHSPHRGFVPYLPGILYPLVIARRYDVSYGLLPQTIFNLDGPYESLVLDLLNDAEFIWTRENRTYEYLSEHPQITTHVLDGLDATFLIGTVQTTPEERSPHASSSASIAVTPRLSELGDTGDIGDTEGEDLEQFVKQYLRNLLAKGHDVTVVAQTVMEQQWVDQNRVLLESIGANVFESYDPIELMKFYSRCDMLATMRLHAGIFALSQGTPAIGVYREQWGPKIAGTWESLGIEKYVHSWTDIDIDQLDALTDEILDNREQLEGRINKTVSEKTEGMRKNIRHELTTE